MKVTIFYTDRKTAPTDINGVLYTNVSGGFFCIFMKDEITEYYIPAHTVSWIKKETEEQCPE